MSIKPIAYDLTEKQIEVVNYEGDELLVKGIAGSGKTTVLLRKASKMIEDNPSIKIGLFTYNKTLSTYAKYYANEIGPENLFVNTFHGWAFHALKQVMNMNWVKVANVKEQTGFLKEAINMNSKGNNNRFINEDHYKEFLLEEISWIKGKGVIHTLTDYINISRVGRGGDVRVTKQDRPVIFSIYEAYEVSKKKAGKIDYDDYGLLIYNNKEKLRDQFKFDHVMIDEGQDLQQIQLMLLRYIAKEGFIIAADKGQKIYKTSFAWKDIGINILGGRTKILQNSFRSTKQIIQMAHSLQLNDSIVQDEEYVAPILPEYTGPKPDVYECISKQTQDAAIIISLQNIRKDNPDATIGILSKEWKSLRRLYYALQAAIIPHEFIEKGKGNAHTEGVKLTTFHSAKGLEFDYVIIIDLNNDQEEIYNKEDEFLEVERRLLYVAITRAKTYLQLYFYDEPSLLLKEINAAFYNKHKI